MCGTEEVLKFFINLEDNIALALIVRRKPHSRLWFWSQGLVTAALLHCENFLNEEPRSIRK